MKACEQLAGGPEAAAKAAAAAGEDAEAAAEAKAVVKESGRPELGPAALCEASLRIAAQCAYEVVYDLLSDKSAVLDKRVAMDWLKEVLVLASQGEPHWSDEPEEIQLVCAEAWHDRPLSRVNFSQLHERVVEHEMSLKFGSCTFGSLCGVQTKHQDRTKEMLWPSWQAILDAVMMWLEQQTATAAHGEDTEASFPPELAGFGFESRLDS